MFNNDDGDEPLNNDEDGDEPLNNDDGGDEPSNNVESVPSDLQPADNNVQVASLNLALSDYVVVNFFMAEQSTKSRNFIGKILDFVDDDQIKVQFLTLKDTKQNKGFVYTYPQVDYIVEVDAKQIVLKLDPPIDVLRGAKLFNVDLTTL